MDKAETVTLFNDMCILAPATLIEPSVAWEPVDARTARARFTHGPQVIAATLHFDAQGFSTPLRDYRAFGPFHLAGFGEARWHPPEGAFAYGRFEMLEITCNVRP